MTDLSFYDKTGCHAADALALIAGLDQRSVRLCIIAMRALQCHTGVPLEGIVTLRNLPERPVVPGDNSPDMVQRATNTSALALSLLRNPLASSMLPQRRLEALPLTLMRHRHSEGL